MPLKIERASRTEGLRLPAQVVRASRTADREPHKLPIRRVLGPARANGGWADVQQICARFPSRCRGSNVPVRDRGILPQCGFRAACARSGGPTGKLGNSVVSVHLGCVAGDIHTLLAGELARQRRRGSCLSEERWHEDRAAPQGPQS